MDWNEFFMFIYPQDVYDDVVREKSWIEDVISNCLSVFA